MCTVTYVPSEEGFVLTSSRDEHVSRPSAHFPVLRNVNEAFLWSPVDAQAGGTWVGMLHKPNGHLRTLCLLNGAFEPHQHRPPYRQSRGVVVHDAFKHPSMTDFMENYTLEGIEPFTLLILEGSNPEQVAELIWDGKRRHVSEHKPQPMVWSSVTLYEPRVRALRQTWLHNWLATEEYGQEAMFRFHKEAGNGQPAECVLMRRENLMTVSITSIASGADMACCIYEEVSTGQSIQWGRHWQ